MDKNEKVNPNLGNTRINGASEGLARGAKLTGRINRAVSIGEEAIRLNGAAFDSPFAKRENAAPKWGVWVEGSSPARGYVAKWMDRFDGSRVEFSTQAEAEAAALAQNRDRRAGNTWGYEAMEIRNAKDKCTGCAKSLAPDETWDSYGTGKPWCHDCDGTKAQQFAKRENAEAFTCPMCHQEGKKSSMKMDGKTICARCAKDTERQMKNANLHEEYKGYVLHPTGNGTTGIQRGDYPGSDVMTVNGGTAEAKAWVDKNPIQPLRKNATGDTYFCSDCKAWMSDATVGVHDRKNPTHSSYVYDAAGKLKGAHWAKEEKQNASIDFERAWDTATEAHRRAWGLRVDLTDPSILRRQWFQEREEDRALLEKAMRENAFENAADGEAAALWTKAHPQRLRAILDSLGLDPNLSDSAWSQLSAQVRARLAPKLTETAGARAENSRKNAQANAGDIRKAIIVQSGGGASGWIIADSEGRRLYGPYPSYSAAEADFKRRNLEMANAGDDGFLRQSGMGLAPAPEPGDALEEPQPIMANARAAVRVKRGSEKYGKQ